MSLEAWGDENPDDADYYSWSNRACEEGWFDPDDYSPGAIAILKERDRQETDEGWSPEHDDAHDQCELSLAGAVYALSGSADSALFNDLRIRAVQELWPFLNHWFKPTGGREDLVKAGALIAAEIDRLDRLEKSRVDTEDQAKPLAPAE